MTILKRYYPGSYSDRQYQLDKRIVRHALFISSAFVIILWLVKIFEFEFNFEIYNWGILPHTAIGLRGLIFAPLIHADFDHLIANSFPLFILTFTLFFFYRNSAYLIFFLIYIFSGLFVWIVGREVIHIGASGVIYGLAGFLFLSGIISYNIRLLTISMIVALFYGGLFWGIFPYKPHISWESHLWGGLSGLGLALLFRKSAPSNSQFDSEEEDQDQDDEYNFEPDSDQREELH